MPVAACWPPSVVLLYVFVGFFISLTMTERVEQRYCIKFCHELSDSQSKTIHKIQQVFGEDAMGVTQIKEWFNRFKKAAHHWRVNTALGGHKPLGMQLLLREWKIW